MKIVVASRKGGVGKTSLTAGLSSLLSAASRRVLAVDLDPQSNLAFVLGGDVEAPGTAELLLGDSIEPITVAPNLDVLPGGPALNAHDISRLHPEELGDILESWPYDDVLFDCPPGLETLERLGILAAECALVPLTAHATAIIGARRVLDDLEHARSRGRRGPRRWALVANRIDVRRRLDRNIDDLFSDTSVPRFRVRQDAKLDYATASGIPLAEHAPTGKAAEDIRLIMEWCRE